VSAAVLGIGNVLLRDDGVGVRAVEALAARGAPPGVELVDGGTSTLDMLGLFLRRDRLVIVDALRGGHAPGTVYRVTPEQLGAQQGPSASLHEVQILDVLRIAGLLGKAPAVTIVGVEPGAVEPCIGLTPAVEAALPAVLDVVLAELSAAPVAGPRAGGAGAAGS
jgi:hydrogenase maturation protease